MGDGLTREEAKDIYEKLNAISLSIVKIEATCQRFMEHLEEHKQNSSNWRNAFIAGVVGMLFAVMSGLIGYWIAGHTERKSDESNSGIKKVEKQPQESLGCELL